MHGRLLALASALWLALSSPCGADASAPPCRPSRAGTPAASVREVRLTGELRFYRHIDPVTGRGAASLHAGGEAIPLDFRRFETDILLRPGTYVVEGHWGAGGRLVVTGASPAGGRHAAPPRRGAAGVTPAGVVGILYR
jgi:hypothetical protein